MEAKHSRLATVGVLPVRVLVTGVRGKVGMAAAEALARRGHEVIGTDLARPDYGSRTGPKYVQADLTRAGDAFAVVHGIDAVVHAAAIPEPTQNVAHEVFGNNILAAFNVIEAGVRSGMGRIVNISSDTVIGGTWAQHPKPPRYCPIDEDHPLVPQDPYALSKYFAEQLCDAAVIRSEISAVSIRPTWVQAKATYEENVGPYVRDHTIPSTVFWSYVDVHDLADLIVLATEATTSGHEIVYAAQPDNMGGRDLHAAVAAQYPTVELRPIDRVDASGICIDKARRLFGWEPRRSWRDYLDATGHSIPRSSSSL